MDVRLFALEDPDVCLVRRLRRDLLERGRSVESVLQQYEQFVKPSYEACVTSASGPPPPPIAPRLGSMRGTCEPHLLRWLRVPCGLHTAAERARRATSSRSKMGHPFISPTHTYPSRPQLCAALHGVRGHHRAKGGHKQRRGQDPAPRDQGPNG